MKKRFKVLFLSIFYSLFIFKGSCKVCYDFSQESDDSSFDYYNGVNLYFVSSFDEIKDDNNVYVVDFRNDVDPNLIVSNSYRIKDLKMIRWILSCLKLYEDMYPSSWNRSFNSMEYEWFVHNLGYEIGLFIDNCKDVDFNNYDEDKIIPGLYKYIKK